ncbi:NUDIX hydrolase [Candidatus Gottesmanbacteria bacterium]|nr:NUDIX hydrolase [Candidatus Gottesmanbacteria bacterium]
MNKPFYVSGFLYHLVSQQILLHQSLVGKNPLTTWNMFGGSSRKGEDAPSALQRILYEQLNIHIETKNLYPVYDYFYEALNKVHYVFYVEVKKLYAPPSLSAGTCSWFTFKQTTKLSLAEQAKHDVIISERVINAQTRSHLPIASA